MCCFIFYISFIFQGNLVRELKAKNDKSVWQPEVELLLNLKKKLADLKGNAEKKSPAKNKKADSTNMQKQNAIAAKQESARRHTDETKLIDLKNKQISGEELPKVMDVRYFNQIKI